MNPPQNLTIFVAGDEDMQSDVGDSLGIEAPESTETYSRLQINQEMPGGYTLNIDQSMVPEDSQFVTVFELIRSVLLIFMAIFFTFVNIRWLRMLLG